MSNQQIPNLPAAIALGGTEQFEAVQAGSSVRVNTAQLGAYLTTVFPFDSGTLPVANGGTGATTAQAASQNLDTALTVEDLAALKALTSRPESVIVKTGSAAGMWQWVVGSTTTADDEFVVECTSGAAGRYNRLYDAATSGGWKQDQADQLFVWLGTSIPRGGAGVVNTITMTIGTPGVVTQVAHGYAANTPLEFSVSSGGTTLTPIVTSTVVYYVKTVIDADNYTVSSTAGGAALDFSGTQSGTHYASESLVWGGLAGCWPDVFSRGEWAVDRGTFWNCSKDGARTADQLAAYTAGTSYNGRVIPAPHDISPAVTGNTGRAFLFLDCLSYADAIDGETTTHSINNLTSIAVAAQADGYIVINVLEPFTSGTVAYVTHVDTVSQAVRDGTIPGDLVLDFTDIMSLPHSSTTWFADGIHPAFRGAEWMGDYTDQFMRNKGVGSASLGSGERTVRGNILQASGAVVVLGYPTASYARIAGNNDTVVFQTGAGGAYAQAYGSIFTATSSVMYLGGATVTDTRLANNSGKLVVQKGDTSAYAPVEASTVTATSSVMYLGGATVTDTRLANNSGKLVVQKGDSSVNAPVEASIFTATSAAVYLGGATVTDTRLINNSGTLIVQKGNSSANAPLEASIVTATSSAVRFGGATSSDGRLVWNAGALFVQKGDGSSGANLTGTGAIKSTAATAGGVGYGTGAGGAVTQLTSKATTCVLNNPSGVVTTFNDALNAGASVSFTMTNSNIAATDVLFFQHNSGGTVGAYAIRGVSNAGSATVTLTNTTGGNLSEALVINFAVLKAVSS